MPPNAPTPKPNAPRVAVMTHLFPTDENPLQGPWVAEQVDALAAYAQMRVLCCSQSTSNRQVTRESGVAVEFHRTATPLGRGRPGLIASSLRYERVANAYVRRSRADLDLIHAHFGFPDAVIAARVSRRFSLPFVVTLHGDDAFKLLPRAGQVGDQVRRAAREADALICVSEAMARAAREALDGQVAPWVVENGYDDSTFLLADVDRDIGVLFVGLLVPVKNVDLLLHAYRRVQVRLERPLVIAGDGPLRRQLEVLASELGLADSVRFVGPQSREQVAALMQRARCLALPSSSEGWGMVVAEALACGTPVVASNVGGVPEIMSRPSAGELVPPGSVEALADALARVATAPLDTDAVAGSSGAHPWSEQAAAIAEVYLDVLDRREALS